MTRRELTAHRLAWLAAHPGATDRELGLAWGVTSVRVCQFRSHYHIPPRGRVWPAPPPGRNAEIVRRVAEGERKAVLAREHGLSRQRVGQLVARVTGE